MKILLISLGEHPAPGGVDTYINMVKTALTRRGHDVDLLCYSDLNKLPLESLTKIKEYYNTLKSYLGDKVPQAFINFEFQKFVHQEMLTNFDLTAYDIFHSQSGIISKVIKQVYPKVPLVGTIHSCIFTESILEGWVQDNNQAELFREYDYDAVNYPEKVITISSILDENMVEIPMRKREMIFNAIDVGSFKPNQKEGSKIKIATSGLLVYMKGYDVLLKGLQELKKYEAQFEVSIFGDGPELQKLTDFSLKNKLPVTFYGYIDRDRLSFELSNHHIFVQPSRSEAFGLSVTEAMASGCVPICSKVGGLQDQINHLNNGLLFESENSNQLAKEIAFLIENKELRMKMREKSIQVVKEKFSLEVFGEKLENVYNKAVEEGANK